MRRILLATALVLQACPRAVEPDGGQQVDSGIPVPCDSPEDCKALGAPGVCRQGFCSDRVPCADDLECGLGEACRDRVCAFVGCVTDADCPTGRCRPEAFTCAECGNNADCPFNRPICQATTQKCVQCRSDNDCPVPGPSHCEGVSATCMHCLADEHCPNGLNCSGGVCVGAAMGQACPMGTACAEGLTCVSVGGVPTCLLGCNAYAPQCPAGQICYTLRYSDSSSYVFDMGALLGVCFTPVSNARNYRDSCMVNAQGASNCQPSLACIPDTAQTAACRSYCDPGAVGACPSPEICHPFSGDFNGRRYGICYADNGWGATCTADSRCRAGQSCQAFPDPADLLITACQFNVGGSAGLAPCSNRVQPDGGSVLADRQCQSGACRGDTFPSTAPYFCYAACETDQDCAIGSRTGTCDGDFSFPIPNEPGFNSFLKGCRPGCLNNPSCAAYEIDGGAVCRPRLTTAAANSGLKLNCGRANPLGQRAGAPCSTSNQCMSGFCSTSDARGVTRAGYCLEPCQSPAECVDAQDGGTPFAPMDCADTAFLGYRGPDGQPGTRDDVLSIRRVCSGVSCNEDSDCSADGGARCVPEVSPVDAGAVVLRCRPPAAGAVAEAGLPCIQDQGCLSGVCATLSNNSKVCFKACDLQGVSQCPPGLSCQAGAFRFTTTAGNVVTLDGCAP